jgi:hypothetical protein
MNPGASFRERWLADAALGFPDAQEAGVAQDLRTYLDEFHRFRTFRAEDLARASLNESTVSFLLFNGLPEDAPPFLSLERERCVLRPLPDVWPTRKSSDLSHFLCLYVDNCGDPICIDRRDSTIVWLDHEVEFGVRRYVNGSVALFAEFLLAAQRRCLGLPDVEPPQALEPRAMQPGSFWAAQFPPVIARASPMGQG